jgi:hypothetical protein
VRYSGAVVGDSGGILNRVRVQERERHLVSRRFYRTILGRALAGNETVPRDCLISHVLVTSHKNVLKRRTKNYFTRKESGLEVNTV